MQTIEMINNIYIKHNMLWAKILSNIYIDKNIYVDAR